MFRRKVQRWSSWRSWTFVDVVGRIGGEAKVANQRVLALAAWLFRPRCQAAGEKRAGRYNGAMSKPPPRYVQPYRYASPNIPLSAIKRFARRIADQFHPAKIILFGSYAYGTPHEESDVDLLVIMPCRNEIDQSIRIGLAFERPFSFDLIVRKPYHMQQGLKEDDCDWFLREIAEKGKVLYEAPNANGGIGTC
jgi:uncharacterized protein